MAVLWNLVNGQNLDPFGSGMRGFQAGRGVSNDRATQSTLAQLAQGGISEEDAARALLATNPQAGSILSNLAGRREDREFRQQSRQEDTAFRQQQAEQARRQFEMTHALNQQRVNQAGTSGGGVYGTPIYGRDPETGKPVLGAIGKDGSFHRLDTGGVQVTPGVTWQDFGTHRQAFDRAGNPVTPPVPRQGDIPSGYSNLGVDQSGAPAIAPMQGSPDYQKAIEAERKGAGRAQQTATTANVVKDEIGRLKTLVQSAPVYNPAVGFGAGVASNIAGTYGSDAAQLIETIKANIGFDRLQRMREESPTGGALGQVAVQELTALQATIGSLSQAQSKEQFLQTLDRIDKMYDDILRKASAYPNAQRYGFGSGGNQSQSTPSPRKNEIPEGVDPQIWRFMTPEEQALWQ